MRQHFFGVAVGLDVLEDVGDFAVGADEEGSAGDALHLLAVHVLLFDHAKLVGDGLVLVGQERVRQLVLVLELLLGGRRVGGDAEYGDSGSGKLAVCVAEPARFYGSAGRVGLGKEEQHHRLAPQLLQRHHLAVLVR